MGHKNIWKFIKSGSDKRNCEREYCWVELHPHLGFSGVSLGRVRTRWFGCDEYLVIYRNTLNPHNIHCDVEWIPERILTHRIIK